MIALGCDHGGYNLMREIKSLLDGKNLEYRDFGTFSEDSCDYPDYAKPVADAVASGECARGILVCGTGIGMSIAANKVRGIRAALCGDCFSAEATRLHNDANILCLGARVTGPGLALKIVEVFLSTEFEGGRHTRRVEKIAELER
ncbi:MAG: ribose 5-phosphate isomerase B [Oscillospiraceae bacterium]|jgi:ribose 5-phosphate isomerase B|nr:ribose 5-phosphate isomerase B [Oscillospiraceae bacterium]